jgi:hypothetical protein
MDIEIDGFSQYIYTQIDVYDIMLITSILTNCIDTFILSSTVVSFLLEVGNILRVSLF